MSTSHSTAPARHALAEDLHVQVLGADVEDERGQQVAGDLDTAVARHRHHDLMTEPGERRRQRGGDVGEAAGLRVRQHLRRDHQDRQPIRRLAGNDRRRAVQRRRRRQHRLDRRTAAASADAVASGSMVWRRAAAGGGVRLAVAVRGARVGGRLGRRLAAPWRPAFDGAFTAAASWLAGSSRRTAGAGGATFGSGVPAAPACARASAAFGDVRRRRGAAVAGVAGGASGRGVDAAGALGGTASADGGMGFFLRAIVGSATSSHERG